MGWNACVQVEHPREVIVMDQLTINLYTIDQLKEILKLWHSKCHSSDQR